MKVTDDDSPSPIKSFLLEKRNHQSTPKSKLQNDLEKCSKQKVQIISYLICCILIRQ